MILKFLKYKDRKKILILGSFFKNYYTKVSQVNKYQLACL